MAEADPDARPAETSAGGGMIRAVLERPEQPLDLLARAGADLPQPRSAHDTKRNESKLPVGSGCAPGQGRVC